MGGSSNSFGDTDVDPGSTLDPVTHSLLVGTHVQLVYPGRCLQSRDASVPSWESPDLHASFANKGSTQRA